MLFGRNKKKDVKNESYTLQQMNEFFQQMSGEISNDKLNSSTYYACMDIRCKSLAKLPLKLYKETEKGKEKANDFYLYNLIKERPNPYMSMHDFLYAVEFQKLEYGNAYIAMVVEKGKIQELYPLESNKVTIWVDDAGIIGKSNAVWYEYTNKLGQSIKFRHSEIAHLKNFSKDGITGIPIKKYLAEVIENEQYGNTFLNNHFKNGLSGGAVLNYTSDLKDERVTQLREKFEKMTSGIKNAGRIMPVPIGFKLEPFNISLVDSEFFKMQGLTVRHIANAFGVKLFQLNDLERSTYGNVETQNIAYYSDTLQNTITQAEQEFDYKFLTKDHRKQGYFFKFNVDSILRSDFKTRMEGYALAIQNAIYSPADCREKEDMIFIEGSDRLVCNGNMIPLNQAGKQYQEGGKG